MSKWVQGWEQGLPCSLELSVAQGPACLPCPGPCSTLSLVTCQEGETDLSLVTADQGLGPI